MPAMQTEDFRATGASYRQVDFWTRCGYLHPHARKPEHGSGYPRSYPAIEVYVCRLMVRLVEAGMKPSVAARAARQGLGPHDLGHGVHLTLEPEPAWPAPTDNPPDQTTAVNTPSTSTAATTYAEGGSPSSTEQPASTSTPGHCTLAVRPTLRLVGAASAPSSPDDVDRRVDELFEQMYPNGYPES